MIRSDARRISSRVPSRGWRCWRRVSGSGWGRREGSWRGLLREGRRRSLELDRGRSVWRGSSRVLLYSFFGSLAGGGSHDGWLSVDAVRKGKPHRLSPTMTPVVRFLLTLMSVNIDYSLLSDPAISSSLVDAFNASLSNATLPSFLGPVRITSFDFGTEEPDVEVVGLRDVFREFLDAEDEEEEEGGDGEEQGEEDERGRMQEQEQQGRSGWARPRAGTDVDHRSSSSSRRLSSASYTPIGNSRPPPPAHRYSSSVASATPSSFAHLARPPFNPAFTSAPFTSRVGLGSIHNSPLPSPFLSRAPSFASIHSPLQSRSSSPPPHASHRPSLPEGRSSREDADGPFSSSNEHQRPAPDTASSGPPSLQLHLRIHHPSNIRLSLTTTLLINHPSPSFMSLPLQLTVTRLELDLHLVIAFQASSPPSVTRKPSSSPPSTSGSRVHISILDELDPHTPSSSSTPSSFSAATNPGSHPSHNPQHAGGDGGKPLPVGERIIPSMQIETSIGQEGEHVLRNVAKVERFVLDLLRKTMVDELVFPNFHSIAFDF
jgi:distribution and morphology protein 12